MPARIKAPNSVAAIGNLAYAFCHNLAMTFFISIFPLPWQGRGIKGVRFSFCASSRLVGVIRVEKFPLLRKLLDAQMIASACDVGWDNGDVEALLSLYADNPVLLPQGQPAIIGKDTIRYSPCNRSENHHGKEKIPPNHNR